MDSLQPFPLDMLLGALTQHSDGMEGAPATHCFRLQEVDAGGEHLVKVYSINKAVHLQMKS